MEIYRNITRPLRCRAAGTWPPGCRAAGAYLQKKRENKFADRSLGTGRPAGGRPAPHPYIRVLAAPPLSFALLKI